ncbi:MAG: addiction module protein [Nitrospirota bacterium]|nr:addiction module protein [Nitrospirota bacterium]
MPLTVKEIEKEALKLDARARALLAEHLINSLDAEEDPEAEKAWVEEAERRYQEYKKSGIKARSAELVMREAREKYK